MRLVYQLLKPLCFYFEATLVPLPPRLRPAVRSLPRLVQPSDGADTLRSGAERRGAEQRGPTWQQSCPDSSRRTTCSPTSLNFYRSSPRHEPRGTVEFGPRTSNSEVTEKVVFLLRAAGEPSPPPVWQVTPEMSGSYCKSLYPFSGEQHQQGLSFEAGDIIKVVQALPGGWWEGERDGDRGWFPSSYVQVLEVRTLMMTAYWNLFRC